MVKMVGMKGRMSEKYGRGCALALPELFLQFCDSLVLFLSRISHLLHDPTLMSHSIVQFLMQKLRLLCRGKKGQKYFQCNENK
jgi:hypothetical protein